MKYLFLLFFSISSIVFSQDIILKINGDSISSKITEIGINEIKYHKYDNLEGPLYIIAKNEVAKIEFENGSSEFFKTKQEQKEANLEEIKATIIEYMGKYAYVRNGNKKYYAAFEDQYLRLIHGKSGKMHNDSYLYDLSRDCTIHELSNRNEGISYINIVTTKYGQSRKGKIYKLYKEKLVILVKRHDNAEILHDALVEYNEFFK